MGEGREFREGEPRAVGVWPSCVPLPTVLGGAGDSPVFVGTVPVHTVRVKCTLLRRGA